MSVRVAALRPHPFTHSPDLSDYLFSLGLVPLGIHLSNIRGGMTQDYLCRFKAVLLSDLSGSCMP